MRAQRRPFDFVCGNPSVVSCERKTPLQGNTRDILLGHIARRTKKTSGKHFFAHVRVEESVAAAANFKKKEKKFGCLMLIFSVEKTNLFT